MVSFDQKGPMFDDIQRARRAGLSTQGLITRGRKVVSLHMQGHTQATEVTNTRPFPTVCKSCELRCPLEVVDRKASAAIIRGAIQ